MIKEVKKTLQKQFKKLQKHQLYTTDVDGSMLWNLYLDSFPEGTNPIYQERREYDCQACKRFIKQAGSIVAIINNKVVSIWDVKVGGFFQVVIDALAEHVKSKPIKNIFLNKEKIIGLDFNYQAIGDEIITWNHLYFEIPNKFVDKINKGTKLSKTRSARDVFKRGLEEISFDALDTVIDLIDQNSIYRGEEHRASVIGFKKSKQDFEKAVNKDLFIWDKATKERGSITGIKNTVIGTLLMDISQGMDLDRAVESFESKVAPHNYKRPTALITPKMIKQAQKNIEELDLVASLGRRHAVTEDIIINNVLFADRKAKEEMNVFDEMMQEVKQDTKSLNRVEEVDIQVFIDSILPSATSIELLFENKHANNLFSLIAPKDLDAKGMFKWNNNFSWTYAGELADSIKERVKAAGGTVTGDFRASLSWFNTDDLDLHLKEPIGFHIHFNRKINNSSGGNLDVDMNAGTQRVRGAVENITYPDKRKMQEGIYQLWVNNYSKRESKDIGFEVEIEFDGTIYHFNYPKLVKQNENVQVAKFEYTHKDGLKIIESLPSSQSSKTIWNIPTQQFHKVNLMMLSPNHWDDQVVGNKHYFFVLENCLNDQLARGFFNEFLKEDLREFRKVFEVLGSKMKVEESENQLSGLGFSSTQRNSVYCKVNGSFSRTIKINF